MGLEDPAVAALDGLALVRALLGGRLLEEALDLGGRTELRGRQVVRLAAAVEPLPFERLAARGRHAGELPDDVRGRGPDYVLHVVLGVRLRLGDNGERRGLPERHAFPDGGHEVATDVADPAGAEIAPHAPDERVVDFGRIRADRRRAEPEIPVQVRGRGHRRRQVAATPGEALARGEEICALHRTERARAQQLDRLSVRHERRVLRAHLRDDSVSHGEVAQERRLGVALAERFLEVDVLTLTHRGGGDDRVVVVGDGDVHRVDGVAFILEQLAPVAVEVRLGELLPHAVEVLCVNVAERRHLDLRMSAEALDVATGHVGGADAGVAQQAVGAAHGGDGREAAVPRAAAGRGERHSKPDEFLAVELLFHFHFHAYDLFGSLRV